MHFDIPCKIIHSTQNGEHAWDVVQLDGEWYHVDATFDGGVSGEPGYNYFNMPDSVKGRTSSYPWDHDEVPAANGTRYCYMLTSAAALNDMYEIPAQLKQAINGDKTMLTFTLKDNSGFTRQIAEYICNSFPIDNGWGGIREMHIRSAGRPSINIRLKDTKTVAARFRLRRFRASTKQLPTQTICALIAGGYDKKGSSL